MPKTKKETENPKQSKNPFSAFDLGAQMEKRKENMRNIMQELFGDDKKKD